MLSQEKFKELEDRLSKGKRWIELHGGWSGKVHSYIDPEDHKVICRNRKGIEREHPSVEVLTEEFNSAIEKWHVIWKEWANENDYRFKNIPTKPPQHSKPWNIIKQREAIEKWKHTLKAKRGPDPRTLPIESFT